MSPRSPVRSIWFRPAETIANIAHDNPGYRLFLFPVIAGFAMWPTMALFATDEDDMRSGFILSSLLSFHPLIEVLQVFVAAWLIRITGLWLGGRAGVASIQTAIVWGNLPIVVLAVLALPLMLLSVFLTETMDVTLWWGQSAATASIGWLLFALQTTLVGWSIVILISGLAAVQGYSIWRASLNALIAWAIAAAIVAAVVSAVGGARAVMEVFLAGLDNLVLIDAS